jgi:predicted methyltransferase
MGSDIVRRKGLNAMGSLPCWARLFTTQETKLEKSVSRLILSSILGVSVLALNACGAPDAETPDTDVAQDDTGAHQDAETSPESEPVPEAPSNIELANVIAGEWRTEDALRDNWRHPQQTLEFLGVDPSGTIIEIWPGGGWYSNVLAPWTAANGGTYVAAHFDPAAESEYRRNSRAAFEDKFIGTELYGDVNVTAFNAQTGDIVEAGSADAVLTFRNVHNWLMYGWSEKAFSDFYTALAPGGILGVVDHRLPSTREQDPRASSGYVQQAYVIALAQEAGFEFVGSTELNANPADTADHPFGVWTLPPVRRSANRGEQPADDFDRDGFDAIGESDRMTLLFRKPAQDESPE